MEQNQRILLLVAAILTLAALPAGAQLGMAGPALAWEAIPETDAAHPGTALRMAIVFKLDSGWHVNAHKPLDEFAIPTVLRLEDAPGIAVDRIIYPPHEIFTFSFSPEPLAVYGEEFAIGLVLRVSDDAPVQAHALKASLRYQACNDKQCAPPKTAAMEIPLTVFSPDQPLTPQASPWLARIAWDQETPKKGEAEAEDTTEPKAESGVAVPADEDWRSLAAGFTEMDRFFGFASADEFLAFLDRAESGEAPAAGGALAGRQWWVVLAMILGGGLLLNLTPCVLPLIPINIAIIGAGARAGSRARGFALGGAYGAGIALVYGALGLVVVLGLSSAFGAINATPWFNGAIAVLFIVLALAMFDIIAIDFSKYQARFGVKGGGGGRFLTAVGMGSVSALLAGACVAPVVIYTIVYAQDLYARGIAPALLLPFLLGVGMALPWPFAGAGLSFLPKPGIWMVRVKQAFGVFILAFALYYGHLAYSLFSDRYLVDRDAVAASADAADADGWVLSLEEGLRQARAEQKPVLVDFWATWCKNCMVMNKTTLKDPKVLERLEGYIKVKHQAEDPESEPVKSIWEHYRLIGLPTYLVLQPVDDSERPPTL